MHHHVFDEVAQLQEGIREQARNLRLPWNSNKCFVNSAVAAQVPWQYLRVF